MKIKLLLMTTLIPIVLTGCATKNDVNTLQNQIAFLNQKLEQTTSDNQEKLQSLQKDQARLQPTITRSQLDISLRIEQLEREVASLTNAVEINARESAIANKTLERQLETQSDLLRQEISHQNDTVKKQITTISDSIEKIKITIASTPKTTAPTSTSAIKTPSKQATNEKAYDYARRLYRENRHTQLKSEYQQIYNSATTGEKPGVMYWYGSSVLNLNEYRDAALIFDDLIKKYPNHWSVPFALLKQGHAFRGLGDNNSAELFYRRVITQYSSSDAVKHAKSALEKK